MSRLNGKASEVLDACLSSESPEVRAKVYEIINLSGLEADDPMFLILALTGQMRVFLEAAPAELSKLLTDWKAQNARSLSEIIDAISLIKETQQQQADNIKQHLEIVSNRCVEDIKEAGMAATSAIAQANSETLAQAKNARTETEQLKEELMALRASIEEDRQKNNEILRALLERTGQTMRGLDTAVVEINNSGAAIKKLQRDTIWVKLTDWVSPVVALVVVGMMGFGVGWHLMSIKYNDSLNVFGRNLMKWNNDRIIKCIDDKNPKCTVWIVPPEQRQ